MCGACSQHSKRVGDIGFHERDEIRCAFPVERINEPVRTGTKT